MADGNFKTDQDVAWVVYVLIDRNTDLVLMEDRGPGIGPVFPGGNVDGPELPIDAARRECLEETGVHVPTENWMEVGGPVPLVHKGRQGALFVATTFDRKQVPSLTRDEHARSLWWVDPQTFAELLPEYTGGFQVGNVARRIVDWMDL